MDDVASDLYINYIQSANKGIGAILRFNYKLKEKDIEPSKFIKGLTRFVLDCLYIKNGVGLDDFPPNYIQSVKKLFQTYTEDEVDLILQVVEHGIRYGADEERAELLLTNTAIRIGKIKILTDNLMKERDAAEKENEQAFKEYTQAKNAEKESNNVVKEVAVTESVFSEVFGQNVVELSPNGSGALSSGVIDFLEEEGTDCVDDVLKMLLKN